MSKCDQKEVKREGKTCGLINRLVVEIEFGGEMDENGCNLRLQLWLAERRDVAHG